MNRRNFMKVFLAGVGGLGVLDILSVREAYAFLPANLPPYLRAIVYTKDNEGIWKGKAGSHVPIIEVQGDKVTVFTYHVMTDAHFIVRHTLVDERGNFLGGKVFTPNDREARSTYSLPQGFKGKLYATSFCNLHDLWVAEFEVK
ncbi:MAG: class II SORL domain-containing protein [Caldimicrobium sp.]|nr:class II SORL domain-containing protein [Caldimicrobium sp.]MCX7873042.1 class II SORL domain-containing protein [Caldimicrobium sp.]MDW8094857.1 desulfoferrodoxin family protein [Caldimicrobium sp.]